MRCGGVGGEVDFEVVVDVKGVQEGMVEVQGIVVGVTRLIVSIRC
jgi:hypothetical protein